MDKKYSVGIIVPNDFIKRLPFGGASGFIQNIVMSFQSKLKIFGSGANGTPLWSLYKINGHTDFLATYAISVPSRWPLRLKALCGYLLNRNRILDSDIDVLYIHSPECALPFLFGRKRKPVVFHQHGSGNAVATATYSWARNGLFVWMFDRIHRCIYHRSAWVIAIDKLCLQQAVSQGAKDKVSLLMNAVDFAQFYPNSTHRRSLCSAHNIAEDELAIFFVGRLEEVKQIDRLITAIASVRQKLPVRLFLAGEGSLRGALQLLADKLGVADRVTFLGKVAHDLLPGYYNMADILALPSKMEGVPMVILEALACGTPVLASAVGGIPDLIRSGENGILLDSPNEQQIATAITEMTAISWDRGTISASVSEWSAENVAKKLAVVFESVSAKGGI